MSWKNNKKYWLASTRSIQLKKQFFRTLCPGIVVYSPCNTIVSSRWSVTNKMWLSSRTQPEWNDCSSSLVLLIYMSVCHSLDHGGCTRSQVFWCTFTWWILSPSPPFFSTSVIPEGKGEGGDDAYSERPVPQKHVHFLIGVCLDGFASPSSSSFP